MSVIKKIKLDLLQKSVPPVIDAVQGESLLRILEVHLYSGSVPFNGDWLFASCAYKKPDGTTGWYDTLPNEQPGVSLLQNVVTVVLAPEMLTVPGDVCAVIRIDSEETGSRIITFPFIISVSPDPAIDSPKSENYYSVQTWDEVNAAIDELYTLVGSGGGEGGISPIVTVEPIEGGHRVTIIDAVGEQTFDIMDGKDGAPGSNGKDGYTPVRGKDYWTEQDKNEIKSYVDEAILGGEW